MADRCEGTQAAVGPFVAHMPATGRSLRRELIVRLILPIAALLVLSACDVDSDADNETVTVKYDKERIKKTARDTAHTAKGVARGVGNVADSTGDAIKREVGDVDVDVDVKRTPSRERPPE